MSVRCPQNDYFCRNSNVYLELFSLEEQFFLTKVILHPIALNISTVTWCCMDLKERLRQKPVDVSSPCYCAPVSSTSCHAAVKTKYSYADDR